jgi:hypothetical protein
MAYTPKQRIERHALNAGKYTGEAVLIAMILIGCSGGGCSSIPIPSSPPSDPTWSLGTQIGEENLRWAVTAADSRVIELLKLRRERQCAAQQTLVADHTDLQTVAALDTLPQDAVGRLSDEALLHLKTQLLDELGPQPLLEASNRKCGVLSCGLMRGSGGGWQDPGTTLTYERVTWYPDVSGIASTKTLSRGMKGTLIVADRSVTFRETTKPSVAPVEIEVPYTDIAAVEYKGSNGWDVWRATITHTDGRTDSVTFLGATGAAQTEAFADLLASRVHAREGAGH